ncbi:cyclin-dependent kinase 4 inhibitor C [Crotalus adamanteus]|uniref:Cyclin-dependent kinase 4 inhibitor C n=2 Tax=Crotalus TaxID=8728 RepID=A0AAW1BPZ2_CROAD
MPLREKRSLMHERAQSLHVALTFGPPPLLSCGARRAGVNKDFTRAPTLQSSKTCRASRLVLYQGSTRSSANITIVEGAQESPAVKRRGGGGGAFAWSRPPAQAFLLLPGTPWRLLKSLPLKCGRVFQVKERSNVFPFQKKLRRRSWGGERRYAVDWRRRRRRRRRNRLSRLHPAKKKKIKKKFNGLDSATAAPHTIAGSAADALRGKENGPGGGSFGGLFWRLLARLGLRLWAPVKRAQPPLPLSLEKSAAKRKQRGYGKADAAGAAAAPKPPARRKVRRPLGCADVPGFLGSANPPQPTATLRLLGLPRVHRPGMEAPKSPRTPGGAGQLLSCRDWGLLVGGEERTQGAKPRPSTSATEPATFQEAWPGSRLDRTGMAEPLANELASAAARGDLAQVTNLLENNINVNAQNGFGRTALQVVKLGNPEIARQLLLRGADPDLKDRTGFAVLHDAARAGFLDTLQILLEFQADVNVEDNEGNLPLHLAAQEGHLAVVAFLLERTASRVEHRNKKGATAYDLAKLYKRQAVAKLLENSRRREGALSGD